VGAILRRERKLLRTAGNTFSDFLASLNTLTVDGKKRQEGREVVVGGKNIPQMVSPDEACVVGGAGGQRGQRADSAVSQKVCNQTVLVARAREPPAPSTGELALGDRVKIHELQRTPELNGVLGEIVVPLDRGTGRWGVRADSDGRVRALRPANLLRLDVGRPAAREMEKEKRKKEDPPPPPATFTLQDPHQQTFDCPGN